jgi:hypothetical protein
LAANGPTLNSLLGIVKLKGVPDCETKAMSITAGRVEMRLQAIPYVPASAGLGLIFGEISAYMA